VNQWIHYDLWIPYLADTKIMLLHSGFLYTYGCFRLTVYVEMKFESIQYLLVFSVSLCASGWRIQVIWWCIVASCNSSLLLLPLFAPLEPINFNKQCLLKTKNKLFNHKHNTYLRCTYIQYQYFTFFHYLKPLFVKISSLFCY